MKRGWWVLSFGILASTLLAVLFISYQRPEVNSLPKNILDPLSQSSKNAVEQFRNRITPLENEVGNIQSSLSSIWLQRTSIPGADPFNQQIVAAVRRADDRRKDQLKEAHERLGRIGSQLVDLQQRATALDVRIQDSVRIINDRVSEISQKEKKGQDPLQLIVVLVGLLGSFSTMLFAWRKDAREERDDKC